MTFSDMFRPLTLILKLALPLAISAQEPIRNSLVGEWSLTLPSGEPGWLSVARDEEEMKASLLWAVGAARPVDDAKFEGEQLVFSRIIKQPQIPSKESGVRGEIRIRAEGEQLHGQIISSDTQPVLGFHGKRQPPIPPPPDLAKVSFGDPVDLFNGRDLSGWSLAQPEKKNGWKVRDGVLLNDTPKTDFSAYGEHGNLRTDAEFEDFQLHVEYRLPTGTGGNSGIYLRGLYEVQVTHRDSKMQGIAGPGAVFGRISPTHNAGKTAGEWEALDITLVQRHVTVILNGDKVIDNQPVWGCTGGALHSDVTAPGPIYLQGDHTSVEFRNLVLRPVIDSFVR